MILLARDLIRVRSDFVKTRYQYRPRYPRIIGFYFLNFIAEGPWRIQKVGFLRIGIYFRF